MITPEEFKEARQNAGLSQEEAGKLLDMSQTAEAYQQRRL